MVDLNDVAALGQLDEQGLLGMLARFPKQVQRAVELGHGLAWQPQGITHVVAAGMGGSGIAGDLLGRFLNVPVYGCKGYATPFALNERTLLVAFSYSGNTEETLELFHQGRRSNTPTLCVSSGGELSKLAREAHLSLIDIPAGYPPRQAMGYLSVPVLVWAEKMGLSTVAGQWQTAFETLNALQRRCLPDVAVQDNPAKSLALELQHRVPLVYGTHGNTAVVAQRWKCQINENAKQPAFYNVLPELNHNEIVQFTSAEAFKRLMPQATLVLLRSALDRPSAVRRIEVLKKVLQERHIPVLEAHASGQDELSQVLSLSYLGDWASAYLALCNGINPTPIALIDQVKSQLRSV